VSGNFIEHHQLVTQSTRDGADLNYLFMNKTTANCFSQIDSWIDFTKNINNITKSLNYPFFRGQGNVFRGGGSNSGWRLEPSLYRNRNYTHPVFIDCVKNVLVDPICSKILERIIRKKLNKDIDSDRKILISIMRHLNLPTPFLDWSKNPWIAAYFAFKYPFGSSEKVTVFLFDQYAWNYNKNSLTGRDLKIVQTNELEHSIPRQTAQESVYTYSGKKEIFGELLGDETEGEESFISYCTLPLIDQNEALVHLESMSVSEVNLFPDKLLVEKLKKELDKHIRNHLE